MAIQSNPIKLYERTYQIIHSKILHWKPIQLQFYFYLWSFINYQTYAVAVCVRVCCYIRVRHPITIHPVHMSFFVISVRFSILMLATCWKKNPCKWECCNETNISGRESKQVERAIKWTNESESARVRVRVTEKKNRGRWIAIQTRRKRIRNGKRQGYWMAH